MTNLTSEQYRDVLKHIDNCTEKTPTVQQLLREAVVLFFNRYGDYPEIAGVAPGKISIFGEQTQFDGGLAMPTALPMTTVVVGRKIGGPRFSVVTSADVGKPHKVKFSFSPHRKLAPGNPSWLNIVKGIIENYHEQVPPFEAAITSSVPIGVGFGSSSAIENAFYSFLEILSGKTADPIEKAKAGQKAEEDFACKKVGLVDRITSILAKDRHAMLIDCVTNETQWIPFRNPEVTFIAVDSHEKDRILENEYAERSKYISKACQMLNVTSLRDCTEDDLQLLQSKVDRILKGEVETEGNETKDEEEDDEVDKSSPEINGNGKKNEKVEEEEEVWPEEEYKIMIKRARFFVNEMKRISESLNAWNENDLETFGKNMELSHKSLKEDFDFDNPLLNFLVESSLQMDGVLGSKMVGLGLSFGGGIITMVRKENVENYCRYITEKFAANRGQLSDAVKEQRKINLEKRYRIQEITHSEHYNPKIASSEKIGKVQTYLENGGVLNNAKTVKSPSFNRDRINSLKNRTPCIVKVEKSKGTCGTWARYEKEKQKEEFFRKKSIEEEIIELEESNEVKKMKKMKKMNSPSLTSEMEDQELATPNFYIVSPFAGARKILFTKADILRSSKARPAPDPKCLVKSTLEEFAAEFGENKAEAIGVAPATITLFGEFMEFHLGYIICMALTLVTVTVGARNDSVNLSIKTMADEVENPKVVKTPIPCVRPLEIESRSWVNFVLGCVNEFKGHVPGFNAIINSNIPIQVGLNSCSALQASLYTFLENLTKNCTNDPFEKADRCAKSEYDFKPTPSELVTRCSSIKFYPTFLCKEGNLMFVNCKRHKISQYYFDHPSYVFLIGCCKINSNNVTVESLDERLKMCVTALETLDRNSLLNADLKHLRCLKKRGATEDIVKRVRYVITEHQRTMDAIKSIKEQNYERVGLLMNQSHASLKDDYEVSSPEIEKLVSLAREVDGVLGAKMLGRGLNATVVILLKLSEVDNCISHIRKNYKPKSDKPFFYVTKPSEGAFPLNPRVPEELLPSLRPHQGLQVPLTP